MLQGFPTCRVTGYPEAILRGAGKVSFSINCFPMLEKVGKLPETLAVSTGRCNTI
jgi:hypothetical protein